MCGLRQAGVGWSGVEPPAEQEQAGLICWYLERADWTGRRHSTGRHGQERVARTTPSYSVGRVSARTHTASCWPAGDGRRKEFRMRSSSSRGGVTATARRDEDCGARADAAGLPAGRPRTKQIRPIVHPVL